MKVKLSNYEHFCEFIKCRFRQDKYNTYKLTHDFKCHSEVGSYPCIYLTSKGKIRDLSRLSEYEIEYVKDEDYRSPLAVLAALMKCKHSNGSEVK